jgi:hypothetical protein
MSAPIVFAYLDPTTGSMTYQVVISTVLAAITACRVYWRQLKQALTPGSKQGASQESSPKP